MTKFTIFDDGTIYEWIGDKTIAVTPKQNAALLRRIESGAILPEYKGAGRARVGSFELPPLENKKSVDG